jgi:molybdopterin adenylyltransferase|tara:strand:- start:966 stop:1580 length:615 start_codon:yes stop_codon:yes gene_type:complete
LNSLKFAPTLFCFDTVSDESMSAGEMCKFGILTASDRASAGDYEDISGPAIEAFLSEVLTSPWQIVRKLIPDEQSEIEAAIIDLVDNHNCSVIVTTGGTGPAPRDVTPEATEAVCQRMLPGFGEQMRSISLRYVPTAILSRQTAGIRDESLILNLPGSPRSIREILDEIFAAVPYCVDLIGGPYITTNPDIVNAFRPAHARREN